MIDEVRYNNAISKLTEEITELNRKKSEIISNNDEAIKLKIDEETKKYILQNRDRIIKEVLGEEYLNIENEISIKTKIYQALSDISVTEPEQNTEETELNEENI